MAKQPLNPLLFAPVLPAILIATAYSSYHATFPSHLLVNIFALALLWGGIAAYLRLRKKDATPRSTRNGKRTEWKEGLLDGGGRASEERWRRMRMAETVIGGVAGMITDRTWDGKSAVCWKVILPIATWAGYTLFIAPTHTDHDPTNINKDKTIRSTLKATSKRTLVLAGATLVAGLSCWGGYSSSYTTALGVLNILGYGFAILAISELTHHQNSSNAESDDEDADVEADFLTKLTIGRDLFGFSVVALVVIALVFERFMVGVIFNMDFVGQVLCAAIKLGGSFWVISVVGCMGGAFLETTGFVLAGVYTSSGAGDLLKLGMVGAAAFWFAGEGKANWRNVKGRIALVFAAMALLSLVWVMYTPSDGASIRPNTPPTQSPIIRGPGEVSRHPVMGLIEKATTDYNKLKAKQSTTLRGAVDEYKRRYGMAPPPHFDRWFEYAKKNDVELIDEFDSMMEELLPFWALSPKEIRRRNREAIEYKDQGLVIFSVRNGRVSFPNYDQHRGQQWLMDALKETVADFVELLPDMDLGLNVHDEPRVIVADTDMQLLKEAARRRIEGMKSLGKPQNRNTELPADEKGLPKVDNQKTTLFNVFAHQVTWSHARLACPATSPVRQVDPDTPDATELFLTSSATDDIPFITNLTNFKDVCLRPSLARTHGVFVRPNAYNVAQYLLPILSQSKVNTYADILYPSPWYWANKAPYDPASDRTPYSEKESKLFWRGSTTGSFSRARSWQHSHRQIFIGALHSYGPDKDAKDFLVYDQNYAVNAITRVSQRSLYDVGFNHVGQCDPEDCEEQRIRFGPLKPSASFADSWKNKLLLDLDGNAFSGRFYAFLKSKSAVLKMAVFKEWHEDWIVPWYHFIPLGQEAKEVPELMRWGLETEEGGKVMEMVAARGSEWRGGDRARIKTWFWRLLMEMGRVMGEGREEVGFELD
ncbi:hypothetical protein BJ508DRAFT_410060 [Ascobolus immersus RN42]|uniref:Glycosyl transferase CAP10 domain-containing protein n=1 Tax=Ascobolus immersus RN42 TaxID=1160509 RepID=A0A3N4IQW6_ASCIM|nr:hypothetical protein BJ508DRAFT_410060 [Ascobolus immersus RN42]